MLGRTAYDTLLDHDDVVDRIKAGQTPGGPAMTMRETLAALFELDEILVMDAIYNDAREGADDDHKYIGDGANGLLFYRPRRPGLRIPAAGYTFSWTGYLGATQNGMRIKRFRMEHIQSDRVDIEMYYDHNQISADLGAFIHQITG